MKTPWINRFAIAWSSHCGCSEACYHYTLFHRTKGKTRVLKRFFGIGKREYSALAKQLIKYFKYEHNKDGIHKS